LLIFYSCRHLKKNANLEIDVNKNERDGLEKAKPVPSKNDTEKKRPVKMEVKPVVSTATMQSKSETSENDRVGEKKLLKEEVTSSCC
jgi:hypothetical protein